MTPPEESGETASSTETGGQSISRRGRGASVGQLALAEIPDEELLGNPQFKKGSFGGTLCDDERQKIEEDDTSHDSPEETLMTKNPGGPTTSTSSILDKRQFDREISFHQLPEGDVPLYQEAERVQWDKWVTHRSVEIHSPVVCKFPEKDVALKTA